MQLLAGQGLPGTEKFDLPRVVVVVKQIDIGRRGDVWCRRIEAWYERRRGRGGVRHTKQIHRCRTHR